MSYSLAVYLVELDRVRQVLGSGDQEVLRRGRFSPQDTHDWLLRESAGQMSMCQALGDLVYGTAEPGQYAWTYGYALERICQSIGEKLESTIFETTIHLFLDEVHYVLPLINRGPPFSLPTWNDLPKVGYLTCDDCRKSCKIEINHPHQQVRAARNTLDEWFEAARHEGKDLIGFWY